MLLQRVDAEDLGFAVFQADANAFAFAQNLDRGVGQIELTLRVVVIRFRQRLAQRGDVEHVNTGVDLADLLDLLVRIRLFDNAQNATALFVEHTAVTGRVLTKRGQQRVALLLGQSLEGLGRQQRSVAAQDEQTPLFREFAQSTGHRIAGAACFGLQRDAPLTAGIHVATGLVHPGFDRIAVLRAEHDHMLTGAQGIDRAKDVFQQRQSAQIQQRLGPAGTSTGGVATREDQDVKCGAVGHRAA